MGAVNNKKRLAKLARKKKKRQIKKQRIIKAATHMMAVEHLPIRHCVIHKDLYEDTEETGMGHLMICRSQDEITYHCAMFLIDAGCLGIKDAYRMKLSHDQLTHAYLSLIDVGDEITRPFTRVRPSTAKALIVQAVAYGQSLGFLPHKNYADCMKFFKDVPVDKSVNFVFGDNGQPVYIATPEDSPDFQHDVMATLSKHAGPEGYQTISHTYTNLSDEIFASIQTNPAGWAALFDEEGWDDDEEEEATEHTLEGEVIMVEEEKCAIKNAPKGIAVDEGQVV